MNEGPVSVSVWEGMNVHLWVINASERLACCTHFLQ
jgi:hypothetical protein